MVLSVCSEVPGRSSNWEMMQILGSDYTISVQLWTDLLSKPMVYLDHHDALIERLASQNCWTVLTNVSKDNGFWQMKEQHKRRRAE